MGFNLPQKSYMNRFDEREIPGCCVFDRIETWHKDYNIYRPHSPIGDIPPKKVYAKGSAGAAKEGLRRAKGGSFSASFAACFRVAAKNGNKSNFNI